MTHIYQSMLLRKIIFATGLFVSSIVGVFGANTMNTNALLQSISDVETGGKYWHVGAAGERSQYQIKFDVWKKYSSIPFWKASCRNYQSEAHRVAICYVNEISQNLEMYGVEISSKSVALRWNGGLNRSRFLRRHLSYASRVSNLYDYYKDTLIDAPYDDVPTTTKPIQIVLNVDEPSVTFVRPSSTKTAPKITIFDDDSFIPTLTATM